MLIALTIMTMANMVHIKPFIFRHLTLPYKPTTTTIQLYYGKELYAERKPKIKTW